MRRLGPVRSVCRCARESLPSAAVMFVAVTAETRLPWEGVWTVVVATGASGCHVCGAAWLCGAPAQSAGC